MHGAAGSMAAAAPILPKQRLSLLGERLLNALVSQPLRIGGGLHDNDRPPHMRVLGAAIFGALDPVLAGLCRLEPDRLVLPGHDVMLDAKRRNKKAVDHILRGE